MTSLENNPAPSLEGFPSSPRNGLLSPSRLRSFIKAFAVVACCATAVTAKAAVINGVDFTTVYDATALPDASTPKWTYKTDGSNPTPSQTVDSGNLILNTSAAGSQYYQIPYNASNPVWNGSTAAGTLGTTIEFRMKVDSMVSGTTNAAVIYFSTGDKGYSFYISDTAIISANPTSGTKYLLDTTVFNTYRITLSGDGGGIVNLYINDSPTPAISNYAGTIVATNHIYFGDPSGNTGGQTEWEYFAFTNAGAVAPIPEPATASLALAGIVAVGALARRKLTHR